MNCHSHTAFLSNGNNLLKEICEIFPESFFADYCISLEKVLDFVLCIACVPTGKVNIICEGVKTSHLIPVHNKAC